MKKILFCVLLFAVQLAFGQAISKDPTFASNGISTVSTSNYAWSMTQDSTGKICSSYSVANGSETFIYRLTVNGALDSTFGNSGKVQLPYYTYQCQLKMQSDGKLIVFGYTSAISSYNHTVGVVYRVLPNGQLDNTFGNGGIVVIPTIIGSDIDARSLGLIVQNEKIIIYGMGLTNPHEIHRLHNDGTVDNSFGNNGFVTTKGAFPLGTFVLLDNQKNIICLTKTSSSDSGNGIIEKFNPDGKPILSFGNNGVLQASFNFGYVGKAMVDSNNKIVYSNQNHDIFRINADGTSDNTFTYNLSSYSGLSGGAWIQSIVEKNGFYYIGGNGEGDFSSTYFISRLNPNGSVDPGFGYYSESSSLYSIEEMIINNNDIIVNGSGSIVKYILNNAFLSTLEKGKNDFEISFENPVNQYLIFTTKEKINTIEIYSADGKMVKTIKENHQNVSELPKGMYIVKILFENGKLISKKLIKN